VDDAIPDDAIPEKVMTVAVEDLKNQNMF